MFNNKNHLMVWVLSFFLCFSNSFSVIQAEEELPTEKPEIQAVIKEEHGQGTVEAEQSEEPELFDEIEEIPEEMTEEEKGSETEAISEEEENTEATEEELVEITEEVNSEEEDPEEEISEMEELAEDETLQEKTEKPIEDEEAFDDEQSKNVDEQNNEKENEYNGSVIAEDEIEKGNILATGITYNYSGGTLTINGTGQMNNYSTSSLPEWNAYASQTTKIIVSKGITAVGGYAFYGFSRVTSIVLPDGLTVIRPHAFEGCSSLISVNIPNGVISLESGIFWNCTRLSSVYIPTSVTGLGDSLFYGCSSLTSVNIPDRITSIGSSTFSGCSSLNSITIPSKVTSIGSAAFNKCSNLKKITIPANVTNIGEWAFAYCSSLTEVIIPSKVTMLGGYAFYQCSELKNVSLPNGITSIKEQTFGSCKKITSIIIPSSVTSIDKQAFVSCSSLTSINIPETVTSIGERAFRMCSSLPSITLPSQIKSISNGLFEYCGKLASVTIPNRVQTIGDSAFMDCSQLTSITIPKSVTSIMYQAFYEATNLEVVYYDGTQSQWSSITIGGNNDPLYKAAIISSNVLKAIEAIDSIGTVTLESESIIKKARSLYNNLTSNQKTYVSNYQLLVEAENTFSELLAPTVIMLIDSIGEVTLSSETTIKNARSEYNKLTDDKKGLVANYEILVSAENTLSGLQVEYVTELIANIGEVTLESKQEIADVRKAYNKLSMQQKELITNYSVLEHAETELAELQIQHVIQLIAELPETITSEDKSDVQAVRKAYEQLTTDQKNAVTNYTVLVNAESAIAKIEADKAAAEKVNQSIRKLNKELTLKDKSSVENARTLYDALTEDQKMYVTTYDILIAAEKRIDDLIRYDEVVEEDWHTYPNPDDIPDGLWIAGIPDKVVYSSEKKTFVLRVYDHNKMLKNKMDYTITYKNNIKAGNASIIIKSNKKGNYKETQTVHFTIHPADLGDNNPDITVDALSVQATGKALSPVPVVYFNGKKLKNNTDYTVSYEKYGDRAASGEHIVTINGKGNFTGTRYVTVTVAPTNYYSVSKLTIKSKTVKYADLTGDDFKKEIVSALTIKMGKDSISTNAFEFEDIPDDYRKVGTIKFTLIGKTKFGISGKRTVSVKIMGISLSDKKIKAKTTLSYQYTGQEITIPVGTSLMSYNGTDLIEGTDYEITGYSNNINAGTATLTVSGINNYTGTKKVTFKILPLTTSISYKDVTIEKAYFCKGGSKPTVTIKGKTEGIDYTVKYTENKEAGTFGTATITFKGNYKGTPSIYKTFYIIQKSLSLTTITANDKLYSNKAGQFKSAPVLKDTDGKTLKAGTDYNKTYKYELVREDGSIIRELGTADVAEVDSLIRVTVNSNVDCSGYTGTVSTTYRILNTGKDISKLVFKIANKEYTGSPVTLSEADILSIKSGKNELGLKLGRDYEIVGYTNNNNKGTAKVTFQGIGEYGGTKTVSFKIGQRSIAEYWSGVKQFFSSLF